MKNWSTDVRELKKDEEKFAVWKLEQLINFGLDGEKIPEKKLQMYWQVLHLDPAKRRFLSFIIK